ncbi:MAG: hypothetical protein ACK5AO_05630 [bacterium]|jgi:hypothetical protein
MNIDNMNDHQMDDLPVLKPDLNVVYPNKQELYRKQNTSPVIVIRRLMVAATLILTAGIIWWLTAEEEQQQQVVAVVPTQTEKVSEKTEPLQTTKDAHEVEVSVGNKVSMIRKKVTTPIVVVSIAEVVSENKAQTDFSSKEIVQEEVVSQVVERPRSNFSEEALQSVQLVAQEVSVKVKPQEEKAEVYIPMTAESERKKPFRGLARKLSRTILGEGESLGDEGIIRVANFKIPVSN